MNEERNNDLDSCGSLNSRCFTEDQHHSTSQFGNKDDRYSYEEVEKFSVVLMFDSRVPINANVVDCEATVAKALKISEEKFGHLTIEVKKIFQVINEWSLRVDKKKLSHIRQKGASKYIEEMHSRLSKKLPNLKFDFTCPFVESDSSSTFIAGGSLRHLQDKLINASSLCRNLCNLFENLKKNGEARLLIDDWLNCHVSTSPKVVKECRSSSAIGLIQDHNVMKSKFPPDTTSIVRQLCESTKVQMSLSDLMTDLCLPVESITTVAQHMVYWGIAEVTEKVRDDQIYVIGSYVTDFVQSAKSAEFARKFDWCPFSLAEILSFFSQRQLATFKCENVNSESKPKLIFCAYIYPLKSHTHCLPFFVRLKSDKKAKRHIRSTVPLSIPSNILNEEYSNFNWNKNGVNSFDIKSERTPRWDGLPENPTIFYVSERIVTTLAKILRDSLVSMPSISRVTNIELLHIYLYIKEQLYLLEFLNDQVEDGKPKELKRTSNNTKEGNNNPFRNIPRLANFSMPRLWSSNDELEEDLLKDISDLTESVPPELFEAMRLLIDFSVYCFSQSKRQKGCPRTEAAFFYSQHASMHRTSNVPTKLSNLFTETQIFKQPGLLSSCFLNSYS
ncbi:hypothetical protein IE077_004419 [Cardiosporidium cionae]|uniref:Uncharacterized protein n=1 Tax=Cardiosporidium cionae TaxID=476202 RepID=A0ABQ7JA34_9APIC|nr:hypothetical protein IE077_004419 [Cardiosporidium cionae]|eukprot:KAF8820856.1 hypothetical protein IE077_004419 [Cardiosporidium cionae]